MDKHSTTQRSTQAKFLLVLSITCGIGIFPFILFRTMQKDWLMVTLDVAIVIGMIIVFFYVYKTNQTRYPSILFLVIAQLGAITSFYMNGGHMVNWVYPSMLSTFFVVKPRVALVINFFILLIYSPKLLTYFDVVEIVVIIFSVSISNIIAFRFTQGLREQEKELKKIASEDYLTATGNRRALKAYLDKVWVQLQQDKSSASLIILDLDCFKNINDRYGHLIGDQVLVELSALMKEMLGSQNKVFRYGGEEFLVVCSDMIEQDAYLLAEKIRKGVKNTDLIQQEKITISLGVAEYHEGESIKQWIYRVDQALYQAKNQGRNQTVWV